MQAAEADSRRASVSRVREKSYTVDERALEPEWPRSATAGLEPGELRHATAMTLFGTRPTVISRHRASARPYRHLVPRLPPGSRQE